MSDRKKTVLVTGALGGIGRAICKRFFEEGWCVLATDCLSKPSDFVAYTHFFEINLRQFVVDADCRRKAVSELRAVLPHGLDALVNNAAVQRLGRFADISAEDWQETLDVNLTAPMLLAQELLDVLVQRKGAVVNIASIHRVLTKPGFVAYATAKSALVGLTKAMAVDLQGRVRVNSISPAAIDTAMLRSGFGGDESAISALAHLHPSQTIGTPEEVANCVWFLTSEQMPFLNGANLPIDGGISAVLNDLR